MTDIDYCPFNLDLDSGVLTTTVYPWQNVTRNRRKATKLAENFSRGWHCLHCGKLMPVWKRIDAMYCKEGCRKMAARARRTEPTSKNAIRDLEACDHKGSL